MQKLSYLYYKGVNSLDLSLLIKSKGSWIAAERDKTYVSVPGRNGDLIQDNGRYKNVPIPYTMTVLRNGVRSFADLIAKIKNWLSVGTGYGELWDSYDPRYFRYAAIDGYVNITEELLETTGTFTVNFNCKPYRYSFDGQNIISVPAAGMTLYNPEVLAAKPYIKIYGNGSISLSVNSSTITIADVDGYVELDSETMNAYKGINLLNNKMTGSAFPELVPGDNTIAFTGTVTGAEIVPRWCTI
jgi:predicted phage tail component-like protein